MRFFTARSLALAALVPALVLFVVIPGCAKQSEGERCGDSLGAGANEDCGDGLTCKDKSELLNGATDMAHRCCYTDGNVSDSRCEPKGSTTVPAGGTGGAAVSATSTAGTSTGGTSTGGTGGSGEAGDPIGSAGTGGEGG